MFGKVPLNDTYLAYYATGTNSYTVFDVFRAVAIMFMPPVAFIRNVMIISLTLLEKTEDGLCESDFVDIKPSIR